MDRKALSYLLILSNSTAVQPINRPFSWDCILHAPSREVQLR